jgi:dolichyl-phosphate-mannose-protein mannosyltransferase
MAAYCHAAGLYHGAPMMPTATWGLIRAVRPADALALALLTLLAAGLRIFELGQPGTLVFDESYYAQDACTYLALGRDICGGVSEASWMHPPLGKLIIALGIWLGGYDPAAWRAPSAVAGTLLVPAVYLLARRLSPSVIGAGVAAGIVALDPLSIVSSRVAMLDVFLTLAGVLAVTFAVMHRDALRQGASRTFASPALVAAGLASSAAIAIKWSGILVLVTVVVLVVCWEIAERRRRGPVAGDLRRPATQLVVWLAVLPALVYVAAYIGRLDGQLVAWPWQQDAWPRVFGGRQLRMALFHFGLDGTHPYESPAWSWLIGKRAVPYFFEIDAAGRYREILAFANIAVWLPSLVGVGWAGLRLARHRDLWAAEFVAFLAFAGSYVPWLVLATGRQFVFLHYVLPAIPFLALCAGLAVSALGPRVRSAAAVALIGVAFAVTAFWAPLVYGLPLGYDEWKQRIIFTDCTAQEVKDGRLLPSPHGGVPPPGWCWV